MALLVALQVFWLRSSYEKAYLDLCSKADGHFRSAVIAVMDSTLLRKIEVVPNDKFSQNGKVVFFSTQQIDTTVHLIDKSESMNSTRGSTHVQIYVSSNARMDSVKEMVRPFATRFRKGSLKGSSFMMRMDGDSLNIDSIASQFNRNLIKSGQPLSFEISKKKMAPPFALPTPVDGLARFKSNLLLDEHSQAVGEQLSSFDNVIKSDWVRVPPFGYAVQISAIRPLLLKEISPQIFFSGVLTLLTLMSFIFMYRSIQSQQRLMILKNDFISNITHELKTPIATVSVAIEALKNFKGIDNPKLTGEYLDIAQHELSRLSLLTDKVLITSLFDEHGIKMEFEKIDMEKIVSDVVNSLQLVFEKQKAVVAIEKKGNDFTMEGSDAHLTNVVHNLLDNALKYSPSNPVITISIMEEGDKIFLIVGDKGLGISAEFHKKIFEKFFRMPMGDIHNIKGHGLGLSYVDSVVKSHRGSINLSSQPGMGSTFTITLPKAKG